MFLHKIKLAGFKSFVDPTTIVLPGNLVGVVGPNGCGKSNVADAVRWVMGETSARHLRGDSMADVVFNGSTARKPVGQASVEILIDNTEGERNDNPSAGEQQGETPPTRRIGGPYAAYDEIAIKRRVSRDGQSVYSLNGRRCRRKDVTDVFLGTGLGPRSYAIIEQGMVSRLVEAKPDELREFLEEAAGVSKYKERRRETENRIQHTQENLNRLQDLRDELAKQLQHLERQANQAERYKVLKQEERLRRVQLLSLHWRAFAEELSRREAEVAHQEKTLEERIAEQNRLETLLEKQRADHSTSMNEFNDGYRSVLDAGAEIARGEETLQNLRERARQTEKTLRKEEDAFQEAQSHLTTEQQTIATLQKALAEKEPALAESERMVTETAQEHAQAETAMQEWTQVWENIGLRAAEATRVVQSEEGRIEHLKERLAHASERYIRLQKEQDRLDPRGLQRKIEELDAQVGDQEAIQAQAEVESRKHQQVVQDLRRRLQDISTTINSARERFQEARGRLSSLRALQQEALGKGKGVVTDWLRKHQLIGFPRLAERLEVTNGWERAVEHVLGIALRAVCVDGLEGSVALLMELREGTVTLFDITVPADAINASLPASEIQNRDSDWLLNKISAPWPIHPLFAGIRTAPDLPSALALRPRLGRGESIVTPAGEWLGINWLRVHRGADSTAGVLPREREIKELSALIETLEQEIEDRENDRETMRQTRDAAEKEQSASQARIAEAKRIHASLESRLWEQRRQFEEVTRRSQSIARELAELREQRQEARTTLEQMQQDIQGQKTERDRLARERETEAIKRKEYQQRLSTSRTRWQEARDKSHRLAVDLATIRARYDSLIEAQGREHDQVARLAARCEELRQILAEMEEPLQTQEDQLSRHRDRRTELESVLQSARQRVEGLDAAIRESDHNRHATARRIETDRTTLEEMRINRQETHVRREAVREQVTASGHVIEAILQELPDEANQTEWEGRIKNLEQKLSRLGTVNLAAVEEYAQQAERKEYLDTQHQDLTEALDTLQRAIQDIDKETRNRFTDTYEKVNTQLGILFPRLFGGGHAYLELTDSDPLNAGVTVMARPPGKRNSTIALLSGGEKALTAVALVFALFELNPAPFCLLDEVDAPLDDANVYRFRDLVREMSDRVQFVIITHNKNTMEVANQLVGVTMSEPGVSRLVSVDVENAVALVDQKRG
uniref:Chromosome partition protein Smc n=1 Tax=Candidatus Kentrum sp. MB TaxID=2138164 RepID=A0A451BBH6_9GAMM|nr:MAG: condensin subunit Smc [Candidatus Kentron sp. MB]VFK75622.1 MAG: condensin subunit Smc [Candidatus Kentron sp. MB]